MKPNDPQYKEGDTVYTPEGVAGTVASDPEWSDEDEEYSYFVEWEDGVVDTQLESFFLEPDIEADGDF